MVAEAEVEPEVGSETAVEYKSTRVCVGDFCGSFYASSVVLGGRTFFFL